METTRRPQRTVLNTALWAVQFVTAGILVPFVYFKRISIPRCDQQCDFGLLDATGHIYAVFALVLFLLVGALQFALPARTTTGWWLPLVGIILTIGGAVAASYVSEVALLIR
jgi:hypothetical protein